MYKIFPSDFYSFEFMRVVGMAPTLGSDVGECFEAAEKIKNDDPESWYTAWSEAAENAEWAGTQAIQRGDRETALWGFMRSSNYRRASEFMLHANQNFDDPRLVNAVSKATENFKQACQLLDSPVEYIDIPYENGSLPAYLFLPKRSPDTTKGEKIPVIVNTGGYDSIAEEVYHFTAAGARLRGYATLVFEGPGQGIVLRRDKLYMRPDWEVVVSTVLDRLFCLSDQNPSWNLNLSQIAIIGNSMGAYYALRGATDPRIKACICSDGVYDFGKAGEDRTPFFMKYLPRSISEALLQFVLRFDFRTRWELAHAAMVLGTSTLTEAFESIRAFTLDDLSRGGSIPERITCPVLVTNARDSIYEIEATRIYDSLTQLKEGRTKVFWDPVGTGQGSMQAKVAALSHLHSKVFEWLDDVFGIKRSSIE